MKKILLIVPSLDVRKWKGLARYSYYLYRELKRYFEIDLLEAHSGKKDYLKALFKSFLIGSFSKYDIVHALTPELGSFFNLRNSKQIVTFHDLIPFVDKNTSDFLKSLLLLLYKLSIKSSHKIIANSSLTARLLRKLFNIESVIINPPVDHSLFKFKKKKLGGKINIGFVSNFSFRKRVDIAIKVAALLQEDLECKLTIAGGRLDKSPQYHFDVQQLIERYKIKDYEILEEVNDNVLAKIYRKIHFLIFPSMIEGFGLPIIEAYASGTPVLILKDAIIPEESRKYSIECLDENDMYKKILSLVFKKEEYSSIQKKVFDYSKNFSLRTFLEKHIKLYSSI